MPQVPLDYPTRDASAGGGNRFKVAYGAFIAGILITPLAVGAVAGMWAAEYRWEWLAVVFFPHAMLPWLAGVGSEDLCIIVALAQFPIYGLVLAGAALSNRPALKRWWRILGLLHVLAAAGAAATVWARGQ